VIKGLPFDNQKRFLTMEIPDFSKNGPLERQIIENRN
jgi:hypothetical protein